MALKHSEVTDKILKAAYEVYNTLGYGFFEKVYENALVVECRNLGLSAVQQQPISVIYKEIPVGDYVADVIVENKVIVELKAVSHLDKIHEVQLVNYLKATKLEVGLLINFGPQMKFTRRIFDR